MNINTITQMLFLKINKGLKKRPRRLRFAQKLKILKSVQDGVWVDLGAGNGHYLSFMNGQSYGVDIVPNTEKKIFSYNFNDSVPATLKNSADVIWCSNLIEHVLRPHEFLLTIKNFLKKYQESTGYLVICCPNTLFRNPLIFTGTYQGDHVNFFNITTLKLTVKYAGYEILFSGSPSYGKFGGILSFLSPTIMVVAKPIRGFQYPESAHKILDSDGQITFKNSNFGH